VNSHRSSFGARPAPFSAYTTPAFWSDPHVSRKMLEHHLDSTTFFSSRPVDVIDRSVAWIAERFSVDRASRVLDLGCGPGLYAERLARLGARVVGIDVSPRSIAYAREAAAASALDIEYVEASYLDAEFPDDIDLALLIYRDYCALGPDQRRALLAKVGEALKPGAAFAFDVQAAAGYGDQVEETVVEDDLFDGMFSAEPYVGALERFRYDDEKLILERLTITDGAGTRVFYNWNHFLEPNAVRAELESAGLALDNLLGSFEGDPFDPAHWEYVVVARRPNVDA
jgi:SAM-dependent methyltransferase